METEGKIHISTLLHDLKRMLFVIILVSSIVGMCGDILLHKTRQLTYCSEALLSVGANKSDTRYNMYTNLSVTEQMGKTFSYIMNSEIIEQIVKEDLGYTIPHDSIHMSTKENTNMMTLRVFGESPKQAYEIMHSILNNYQDLCNQVMPGSYVELLQAPKVPLVPYESNSHVKNLVSITLIVFMGLSGIVCGLSYLNDTVKSSEDIENKIDASLLASLPYQKHKDKPILVTDIKTGFSYVETFKKIRLKVEENKSKVIMVTSSQDKEGKTTVSTNLALTLAKNKKKVLLIDLNLRNPSIHHMFQVKVEDEISDYFKGIKKVTDILKYNDLYKIYYILQKHKSNEGPEYISSIKMENMINVLKEHFDYIIIDSASAYAYTDALSTAEFVDTILLVIKQHDAKSVVINDTIDALRSSQKNILGCIFNHRINDAIEQVGHYGYYGRYGGYYGYRKYGYGGYDRNERE